MTDHDGWGAADGPADDRSDAPTVAERLIGGRYRVTGPVPGTAPHVLFEAWDGWAARAVVLLAVTGADGARGDDAAAPRYAGVVSAARTAGRLRDPHLAELLDLTADDDGAPWLVYAWDPHRSTAATRARRREPVPVDRIARWGAAVARGLAAAHAAGLVHGAVGPGLVVVDQSDAGDRPPAVLVGLAAFAHRADARAVAGHPPADAVADVRAAAAVLEVLPQPDAAPGELRDLLAWMRWADDDAVPTASQWADRLEALAGARGTAADASATEQLTFRPDVGSAARTVRSGSPSGESPAGAFSTSRRRTVTILVAVVLALALVAGSAVLTAALLGDGSSSDGATPAAASTSVLGDEHTVDPCSLVDVGSLARFGPATVVPDVGGPEECAVEVKGPGPGDVAVYVQLQASSTDIVLGPRQQVGPYTVARPEANPHDCARTVLVPPTTWIAVVAVAENGSTADLCAHAETAATGVLDALSTGKTAHRPRPVPPGSLVTTDACALLDPGALQVVPGVASDRVERRFGGWGCRWGATSDQNADPPLVAVADRFRGPASLPPTTRVGARDVAVAPDGDPSYWHACVLSLPQRHFTADNGSARVEVLQVTVYAGPQQASADVACDRGRALVPVLASRLPPPA